MEVEVKDLKPNPYRDMDNYPIDTGKVKSLVCSIEQTGFWDNILVRPKPNHTILIDKVEQGIFDPDYDDERFHYLGETKDEDGNPEGYTDPIFELAYGHHRLKAIQQVLKPDDIVDIPVKDLDDATMIQIMANENMEHWSSDAAVINETVLVVKNFLDNELAKYKTWEELKRAFKNKETLFDWDKEPELFTRTKIHGVGVTIIKNFLGKNWTPSRVSSALNTLAEKQAKREAVEVLGSTGAGDEFKKAVKKVNKEREEEGKGAIPKEDTPRIAKAVKKKIKEKKISSGGKSWRGSMTTMVRQEVDDTDEFDSVLKDIQIEIETISNDAKKLSGKIMYFNGKLDEMKVDNIKSLQSLFALDIFGDLLRAIDTMTKYFGYQINDLNK